MKRNWEVVGLCLLAETASKRKRIMLHSIHYAHSVRHEIDIYVLIACSMLIDIPKHMRAYVSESFIRFVSFRFVSFCYPVLHALSNSLIPYCLSTALTGTKRKQRVYSKRHVLATAQPLTPCQPETPWNLYVRKTPCKWMSDWLFCMPRKPGRNEESSLGFLKPHEMKMKRLHAGICILVCV